MGDHVRRRHSLPPSDIYDFRRVSFDTDEWNERTEGPAMLSLYSTLMSYYSEIFASQLFFSRKMGENVETFCSDASVLCYCAMYTLFLKLSSKEQSLKTEVDQMSTLSNVKGAELRRIRCLLDNLETFSLNLVIW